MILLALWGRAVFIGDRHLKETGRLIELRTFLIVYKPKYLISPLMLQTNKAMRKGRDILTSVNLV